MSLTLMAMENPANNVHRFCINLYFASYLILFIKVFDYVICKSSAIILLVLIFLFELFTVHCSLYKVIIMNYNRFVTATIFVKIA